MEQSTGIIRGVLQSVLTAALVLFGPLLWRGCDGVTPPPPVPPQPGPAPAPVPPPAPRPADEHGGQMWDSYQRDGGPTAANVRAKAQLIAVYRLAAQVAVDPQVTTGVTLLERVRKGMTSLIDADYLGALPETRKTINGIVSDHLEPDELTPAKREAAAKLFEAIAKSLGEF